MTAPKRKRGRPLTGGALPARREARIAPRLTEGEAALLERAAEALRRQTGQVHTASSVLRDGGIEYAGRVLGEARGDED